MSYNRAYFRNYKATATQRLCACGRPAVSFHSGAVCAVCLKLEGSEWLHNEACGVSNPDGSALEPMPIHCDLEKVKP